MQDSASDDTVKDILSLLSTRNKRLSWKLNCIYTDGKNNSVMEIKIFQAHQYHNESTKQLCRITYNPDSGQVSQMKYRAEFLYKPGVIVDVLLDIINTESQVVVS